MKIITANWFLRLTSLVLLILEVVVFFYFENSLVLGLLAIFLGLIGFWQFRRLPEILTIFLFYLGLYDFYNIRYGLAVPMAIILIGVLGLTVFLYYLLENFYQFSKILTKDILRVYLVVLVLIVLEIFLTMSLWPVDPKTKSLVIVIAFYLLIRLIYLNAHRVLNLKRAFGFVLVSFLILAAVISISWWQGF